MQLTYRSPRASSKQRRSCSSRFHSSVRSAAGPRLTRAVRLQGTKEKEAKKLIEESSLKIFAFDGLDEAASKAVELSKSDNAPAPA